MSWLGYIPEWIDTAIDTASGWVDSGWDAVNGWVDSNVWDTDADVAIIESYIKDAFDSNVETEELTVQEVTFWPQQSMAEELAAGYAALHDSWDMALENPEAILAETEAIMAGWADEALTQVGKDIDAAKADKDDGEDDATGGADAGLGLAGNLLGMGWDYLCDRLEDLLEIPARVFFNLLVGFFFEEVEE